MKRRLCGAVAPCLWGGFVALLSTSVLADSSTSDGANVSVPARLASDGSTTAKVTDDVPAAQRIGPTRNSSRASGDAAGATLNAREAAPSQSRTAPKPVYRVVDEQAPQTQWRQQVEYPLALHALDRQIALARSRVESYQNRLELFSQYNVWAPPETPSFTPSEIIPRSEEYSPQTAREPVQAFSPGSTFAHVLGAERSRFDEAKMELESLVKQRELLATNGPDRPLPTKSTSVGSTPPVDFSLHLQAVESELKLAQSQQEALERRLQQFDQLSRLTYSNSYSDLREKLRLRSLAARLRVDELQEERERMQTYQTDRRQ
jgi:hypothetical protein